MAPIFIIIHKGRGDKKIEYFKRLSDLSKQNNNFRRK